MNKLERSVILPRSFQFTQIPSIYATLFNKDLQCVLICRLGRDNVCVYQIATLVYKVTWTFTNLRG